MYTVNPSVSVEPGEFQNLSLKIKIELINVSVAPLTDTPPKYTPIVADTVELTMTREKLERLPLILRSNTSLTDPVVLMRVTETVSVTAE